MPATAPPTRSVGLTPEQLETRKKGIGGSEAAAVLGVDPYKTPLHIYELKLGLREPEPPNADMKRGIYLEPVARRLYRELTGRRVHRMRQCVHGTYPFMLCNVDGKIVRARNRDGAIRDGSGKVVNSAFGPGVLELKCPRTWTFAKIKREGLPLPYIVQMQHNLAVTNYSWGSFALFNADLWELLHFDVTADLELHHALVLAEEKFWRQHVEGRVPPPVQQDTTPQLADQLAKAQERIGGGELLVRNDPEWAEAAAQYFEAQEIAETGENLKASTIDKLKRLMGAMGAVEGAGLRCYWSEHDGKLSFDREALEKSRPLDRDKVIAVLSHHIGGESIAAQLGKECWVNFEQFKKRGKQFETFRTYRVKAGVGD
jgi:putative phage-type endonuclease